ncbi:uncharacterized protein LOC130677401 [Microplitis mediator]|uniref:uncharacterized protein LOC130677401 n=1 Tax=Microplitis mediator TaxID=375433 RepID=UPI002554C781|nr:uncharacterized protein LOC130677401 [Microplitis mediator]
MGLSLERMIHLPRDNNTVKNLRVLFNYLLSGFKFLDDFTKNNNVDVAFMDQLLLTSKYNQTTVIFYQILKNIEMIFDSKFVNIWQSYDDNISEDIYSFLNDTVFDPDFRNRITLTDFCHPPNRVDLMTNGKINKNIFQMYFETLQNNFNLNNICEISVTKLIVDFYERILIDVLKGYTMITIGWELFRGREHGYTIKDVQDSFFNKYLNTTKNILYSVNKLNVLITLQHKMYKKCDPDYWTEGNNYIRVKNYVSDHAIFVGKKDRNFNILKNRGQEYECDSFSVHSDLRSESIESMRCPEIFETNPPHNNLFCSDVVDDELKISDHNYSKWDVACYVRTTHNTVFKSFCYCDKHSNKHLSIRTLSLREYRTDTTDSRVVTGIRFAVKDNIISIDIQEGKLVNSTVDRNTVQWVPGNGYPPSKGPDKIKLSFYVKSFNLDDIELPDGYFVTGVKFELLDDNHITLVVRGTKMWEECQSWQSSNHHWFYPITAPHDPREKIDIKDYIHPAELDTGNVVLSRSGSNYVDLSVGLLSYKYNNLPVIPFFDSQSVESNPPSPLGGLALTYKGQISFGGFFAFQLIHSKYTINIFSEMTCYNNL